MRGGIRADPQYSLVHAMGCAISLRYPYLVYTSHQPLPLPLQNPAKYRADACRALASELQLAYLDGGNRGRSAPATRDWRRGRGDQFVRSAAMLCAFPHWGIGAGELPGVIAAAMREAEEAQ